ncbi:MAG: glycoside hydrolase 43 family protein [Bacteroidaceae bacterium]|nr:glycoside hydrolase 43 family protein [Bacteroidaceae bacterium]
MKKKILLAILALMPIVASAQYVSKVWSPDNGDGTYKNPVINADYSDPDVCVVGDDFYMTASSFNCIPGLPILHSKDLVNWEIINYALEKQYPEDFYDKPQHGKGVWAPSIRFHDGEFYIYWGDPDFGVMMVKTKDPYGKWDKPICVIPGKGLIDTTPLWDEDGRCYLVNAYAASRMNINSVLMVRELSADGTKAIGNPTIVFDGNINGNFTSEGPKFYKYNGYYWIMWPAGGVEGGWQMAARAKSPFGPYEYRRVMDQGKSPVNGPHQGGWVHLKNGEDWFMHFQDKGCYGRVVHLQPMTWKNGWPVIGIDKDGDGVGEPVMTYKKPNVAKCPVNNPVESDEFNSPFLGKQWEWHANYHEWYGMPTADGYFRVYTNKLSENFVNLHEAPNLLLQKTTADEFTATAKVRFASKADNQYAGLIMMGRDYSALSIHRVGEKFNLEQIICKGGDKGKPETVEVLKTMKPTSKDKVIYKTAIYMEMYLRLTVEAGGMVTFAYSTDGKKFKKCGKEFKMREGTWIGVKYGFFAEEPAGNTDRGFLDVDWIHVEKN